MTKWTRWTLISPNGRWKTGVRSFAVVLAYLALGWWVVE